jgi:glycosyltransferase involved in cell wall biosynthesis
MNRISAVIITLNEEKNILRCLNSLKDGVDEIVVVDSGSSDDTVKIVQKFGAVVFEAEWKGYGGTKNFGNLSAKYDYILSIDADEELSDELKKSIINIKSDLKDSYCFNRLTNYCGKWIYHCGWYPDKKIRIFNRLEAKWSKDTVHESLMFNLPVQTKQLQGNLLHYPFNSISEHLQRVDSYSEKAALDLAQKNIKFVLPSLLIKPILKFIQSYFIKLGFLDGFHGFCISGISAFDLFFRYAKLYQLQLDKKFDRINPGGNFLKRM